jgi:molybdopterin-biosynthesis enzyme MoeA-like protein
MGVILTSNANFLAMVVRRLGHGVVKTQLVGDFSTTLTLEYKLTQYFSTQLRQL